MTLNTSLRCPAEAKNVFEGNEQLAAKLKRALKEARDQGHTRPGAGE